MPQYFSRKCDVMLSNNVIFTSTQCVVKNISKELFPKKYFVEFMLKIYDI
jgi:hypothetical protein